jgi:hypothetical protein
MRGDTRKHWRSLQYAALLLLILLPTIARGDEYYYMLVFGTQRYLSHPKYSHTFATFVKATGTGPCLDTYQLEVHTLSWLPESLRIDTFALHPEPGRAFDLDETLRWAQCEHAHVSMWGPFQIQKGLYERALERLSLLQSGALAYKVIDVRFRPFEAVDCIHALSDVDDECGFLATGAAYGDRASYLVLLHLKRWITQPCETDDWIADRLCLGMYPITRRSWDGCRPLHYHCVESGTATSCSSCARRP